MLKQERKKSMIIPTSLPEHVYTKQRYKHGL